jgi:predicted ATPase
VESLVGAPILLLGTYRPGYRPPWGEKSYAMQVALRPLGPRDGLVVVRSVAPRERLSDHLAQVILAKAEGNPFFLEEMTRAVVEQEELQAEVAVPDTIQGVLMARIDRLPDAAKRLLQTAAVLGREFSLRLLGTLWEGPGALQPLLGELKRLEFVYEDTGAEEPVYVFKHVLTQEVAYGSLLQERRRALHTRIVAAIETMYADRLAEQVERLARHAFGGEAWDKAVAYYWQAGAKALARSALREAIACFEQALVAVGHLPESQERREQAIDLRLAMRNALIALGAFGAIFDHLCAAERLAASLDDSRRLGWVSAYLSNYFCVTGDQDRAIETGRRALAIAVASKDFALEVMATYFLGLSYLSLGDYRQAVHYHRKAVETLTGEWLHERFGSSGLPSVFSRAWLD